jgi:hypothetical protein
MPFAETLDGPPEWAGTHFENPGEDLADEIGLIHPRWRGIPVWVVGHWRRLADRQGPDKDAQAERIEDEQWQMLRVARAARELRQLQPDEVRSWTSTPPFPARTTYIPMIADELARIRGLGEREWMALQDRVLLIVLPDLDPTTTTGRCTASPGCTAPPGYASAGSGGRA